MPFFVRYCWLFKKTLPPRRCRRDCLGLGDRDRPGRPVGVPPTESSFLWVRLRPSLFPQIGSKLRLIGFGERDRPGRPVGVPPTEASIFCRVFSGSARAL